MRCPLHTDHVPLPDKQKRSLANRHIKIVFYYQCIKFINNTSGSGFVLCHTDIRTLSDLPVNTACLKSDSFRPLVLSSGPLDKPDRFGHLGLKELKVLPDDKL